MSIKLDPSLNPRLIERLSTNWDWVAVSMLDLKDGETFRMFEPLEHDHMKSVVDEFGRSSWKVIGAPFVTDGVAGVMVEKPQILSMSASVKSGVDSLTGRLKVDSNTFEHDYILLLIDAFAAELGVKDASAEVVDKYALALTSFMRGQLFNDEVITAKEIKAILASKVDALKSLKD